MIITGGFWTAGFSAVCGEFSTEAAMTEHEMKTFYHLYIILTDPDKI